VAVFIDDSATVKRISYEKSGVRLMSSNPNYEPIPIETEQAAIIGKVIGLIRDYQNMAF
jgi:SOS-response transcriptional repressor LexA